VEPLNQIRPFLLQPLALLPLFVILLQEGGEGNDARQPFLMLRREPLRNVPFLCLNFHNAGMGFLSLDLFHLAGEQRAARL
jgi:hypothetical protein